MKHFPYCQPLTVPELPSLRWHGGGRSQEGSLKFGSKVWNWAGGQVQSPHGWCFIFPNQKFQNLILSLQTWLFIWLLLFWGEKYFQKGKSVFITCQVLFLAYFFSLKILPKFGLKEIMQESDVPVFRHLFSIWKPIYRHSFNKRVFSKADPAVCLTAVWDLLPSQCISHRIRV